MARSHAATLFLAATLFGGCNKDYPNPFAGISRTLAPPDSARLLFTSNTYTTRAGFPRDIYAVAATGSAVTRLTFCNVDPRRCDTIEASASPDHHRVAVRRVSNDTNGDGRLTEADGAALLVVDLDRATEALIVPASAKVGSVDWSPSGDLLLYTAVAEGGNEDLFRVDPTGQNVGDLTSNVTPVGTVRERRVKFDPFATAATFERIDATGKGQIWIYNGNGSQVRATTGGDGTEPLAGTPYVVGSDADPAYSPDARSLVFRRLTGTGNGGLGTWDVLTALTNGTGLTVIATGPQYRGAPDWSAEGIIFNEIDRTAGTSTLVIVQPGGQGRRVVVTMGSNFEVSFPRFLR